MTRPLPKSKGAVLWLAGVLAILLCLVPGAAQAEGPSPGSSAGSPIFGFNDDWQDARGEFHFAREAGANVIRFPIGWHKVQPTSPLLWDWSFYDEIFEEAREEGLQIIFAPQTSPCWARGAPFGGCENPGLGHPPDAEHLDEYKQFVRAAVQRYPDILAIEAWNEPNLAPFWNPTPSPTNYVPLLRATYEAVKSVRPDMPVLFGGLASVSSNSTNGSRIAYTEFLRTAYKLGAGPYFDALSVHPYVWSEPAQPTAPKTLIKCERSKGKASGKPCRKRASKGTTLRQASLARADRIIERAQGIVSDVKGIMAENGQGAKDVWVTEFGLPTRGRWAVSPQMQGALLPRLGDALAQDPQIKAILFHRMFDSGGKDAYGLVHSDRKTLKPAFCAIAQWRGKSCR